MGTNLSSVQTLTSRTTLIASGGAGLKQGRRLVMNNQNTSLQPLARHAARLGREQRVSRRLDRSH
ncbi:hypothetical protein NB063_03685 [Rhodopirellula sp. ICT_H3.1]|uniref:Uncharacterized protein n=2 Tax=Aporhodopirellula aestuarii TaxID=2950107 RepID=A0ABT0TYR6_9BACT|nr:hypothetical protein [Aporhodopirellula aestuarii]